VAWFLPENRERRNNTTPYWNKRQERYQELAGMAEETLRAELEYWRELEALSGQREHFKPGRTNETGYADDEVDDQPRNFDAELLFYETDLVLGGNPQVIRTG
jgi:hypothetical protein